jgi:hypothetical protein
MQNIVVQYSLCFFKKTSDLELASSMHSGLGYATQPVRLILSARHLTVFFSHNKSASARISQSFSSVLSSWRLMEHEKLPGPRGKEVREGVPSCRPWWVEARILLTFLPLCYRSPKRGDLDPGVDFAGSSPPATAPAPEVETSRGIDDRCSYSPLIAYV